MAPKNNEKAVRDLMQKVNDGNNIVPAIKSLATLDISLALASDLKIIDTLTTHSGHPLLSGPIHEILKKLDGKKGKENSNGTIKKRTSIKRVSVGGSKKRRSSGVMGGGGQKKMVEAKPEEAKEVMKTPTRRFQKKEPSTKPPKSAVWKKVAKKVLG